MSRNNAKTPFEKALKALESTLSSEFEMTQSILRQGDRLIIPSHMTYKAAAKALVRHEEMMEEEAATRWEFDANPHDALVAFYTSVREQFGALMGTVVETWFGTTPALSLDVPIDYGKTMNVPIGESEVPGLPVTFQIRPNIDPKDDDGGDLDVIVRYKRMYQPLVDRIKAAIDERLKNHSIFRGKAINSRFEFMNVAGFDQSRVVYSQHERRQIVANILTPIQRTQEWLRSGASLKRGILLYGPYGTGKTLTAMLTARACIDNGWTFVNVLPKDDIVKALNFAKRYQPAVVFFEDIDSETAEAGRSARLNEILNTVDGMLSKDVQVMIILTTNHVEAIHRSMLRPGRLDAVIRLGELDPQGVADLVRTVARGDDKQSLLETDELDIDALYAAAKGFVPAFIAEAVTKAKSYALARRTNGDKLHMTQEDIIEALFELRPQWELMQSDQTTVAPDLDKALDALVAERISPVQEQVAELDEWIRGRFG